MKNRGIIITVFISILSAVVNAGSFTQGNIVVVRNGDGSSVLSSSATAVFLDEYTRNGVLIQSIPLPTAVQGSNRRFSLAGNATSEGALNRSVDNRYLTLAGYDAALGTAAVNSTTSATVNRVAARIDGNAVIDVSTALTSAFDLNSVRSAVTYDGSYFWFGGNATNISLGGVEITNFGTTSTGYQILAAPNNTRWVNIFDGQLYATSGSGTYTSVFTVGMGIPIMAGQMAFVLPGLPTTGASPYGFALHHVDTTIAGENVLYIGDDRSISLGGGIQKWTFNGSTWALAGTFTTGISTGIRGLTVDWSGANPVLFATTTETSQNKLVTLTDNGLGSSWTVLMTSVPNTVFRGIAFSPSIPTNVDEASNALPDNFTLDQNYPNPFNPSTHIAYTLPAEMHVRLSVYNILGQQVALLANERQSTGKHFAILNASGLSSGVYFYRLEAGSNVQVRKLILAK